MKNPFVGLRPFQAGDKDLFFGRDQDIAILQNLILAAPILVVYAPSGTGKSSLLNAGLIPEVEKDSQYLPIVISGAREDVTQVAARELCASGWEGGAQLAPNNLADLLEHHYKDTERRAILVLDQFEERLKHEAELDHLYAQLARLANTRSSAATVVLSIREDYLAGLAGLMERVSGLLDSSYRVSGLTREDLAEAVRGPIATVDTDIGIDAGLIDQVLDDLESETRSDAMTRSGRIEAGYFQIAWSRLWDIDIGGGGRQITRRTYLAQNNAAGILESFVSSTLLELLPVESEVLWAALRYMVLPTGAKVSLTVDDILGLLRVEDFPAWSASMFGSYTFNEGTPRTTVAKDEVRPHLQAMLDYLTRTESPLFRRATRGERTEYGLVHDLLGIIFLDWQRRYLLDKELSAAKLKEDVLAERGHGSHGSLSTARRNIRTATGLLAVESATDPAPSSADLGKARDQVREAIAIMVASGQRMEDDFKALLDAHARRLERLMLNHPDRRTRGAAQAGSYELFVLLEALNMPLRRLKWFTGVIAWFAGAAAAIGGLAMAQFAIGLVWAVPPVQYIPLTLGVVVIGAASAQCLAYTDRARTDIDRRAAKHFLWPTTSYRPGFPLGVRILIWWPFVYLVLALGSYAGAALFDVFHWAPTAGFNLAVLISALILGSLYLSESDVL